MLATVITLMLLGVLLLFAELFVPGGILGLIGVVMMGIAVYFCFQHYGSQVGVGVLLLSVTFTLGMVIFAFTLFPKTSLGRHIFLADVVSQSQDARKAGFIGADLVGKEGVSESELRPAGIAVIAGNRVDVVTDSEWVEHGVRVRVVRVDGNRIVVERA